MIDLDTSKAGTRIKIAKRDIVSLFERHTKRIFTRSEIGKILAEHREFWRLRQDETIGSFIEFLLKETNLERHDFDFPFRPETRYSWGKVPLYELLQSTQPNSYFSHYTAIYFHELTEQIPKTIYLNKEQKKGSVLSGSLRQEAIDRAFKSKQRASTNTIKYNTFNICILNGKNTGQLGIIEIDGPDGAKVKVTDLERTLIDSAVRPNYSGGVFEVLKAYQNAQKKVSINRLSAYLKKLSYIYPYHQAIGFYLERTGVYKSSQIELFRERQFEYDFYLANAMAEVDYDKNWRLYFPKGF